MRTVVLLSAALFTALTLHALPPGGNAEPVTPVKGQRASGPYTPGILTADYLYVSSQGPRSAGGSMPATIGAQVDQCVENLKAVIEAAGLTMDHVVYTHVYLDDISLYDGMNRAYAKHFGDVPPARAVVGIAKRSNGMHVTMNAVAVRKLSMKKAVSIPGVTINEPYSPGILTHDRMFISGMLGRDLATGDIPGSVAAQVKMALDNVGKVLKAGGLGYEHVVFTNPYVGPGVAYGEMNKVYAGYFEFGAAEYARAGHDPCHQPPS